MRKGLASFIPQSPALSSRSQLLRGSWLTLSVLVVLPQLALLTEFCHFISAGKRDAMEDAFVADSVGPDALFGVFDGHYGKRAAQYSADQLPKVVDGACTLWSLDLWI